MQHVPFEHRGWGHGRGWGRHCHGSPIGLFLGLFILFAILKSGLWLPLLGLGMMFFVFAQMNGRGWCMAGPQSGKRKRGFGPMDSRPWYGTPDEAEKPKRDGYDEYV